MYQLIDYEGSYFPDDEDVPPKKAKRKKILRYCLYALVAAVYVVILSVILCNCEPGIYKRFVFSPAANELYEADPDGFEVYEIYPTTFMNYDGSVQIAGVGYAATAGELEIGVKYNKKLDGEGEPVRFVLTDSNGGVYEICNTVGDEKGRYRYLRVCFAGVRLPLDENAYINPEVSGSAEGEGEMYQTFGYTLQIYANGAEKPDEITIFNSVMPIKLSKFR